MNAFREKRKAQDGAEGPHKAPKLDGSSAVKKLSFAQKMMAKMGYVEGQGLGREGEGIVKPIEVKLRPQGAGVGTVKEKTKQAKDEERRRAEIRGEEYEDSSEEERQKRRSRQRHGTGSRATDSKTTSTHGGKKTKYRTIADVQAAAPGLEVPQTMLSSILDMTGSGQKLLTSSAGLLAPVVVARNETEIERDKLDKRERIEFEAFIDAWHGLQERKIYLEEQEGHHMVQTAQLGDDLQAIRALTTAIEELGMSDPANSAWQSIIAKLLKLKDLRELHSIKEDLHEAAVASILPEFHAQMEAWSVFDEPAMLTEDLTSVVTILGHRDDRLVDTLSHEADEDVTKHQSSTAYESMLYTAWYPKIRRTVQSWNPSDYQVMISLVQSWTPLLPKFVHTALLDNAIVPRLTAALQDWEPSKRHRSHRKSDTKQDDPSLWLFPWLPHLPPYQLDINEPGSLAAEMRRKLRSVLSGWRISSGLIPGLAAFTELPDFDLDNLLVKYLLPRLAAHLARELEINPAEQDLSPLEDVLKWQRYVKPSTIARLLSAELFPKWLITLHYWLTSEDVSFDEIAAWMEWWMSHIPEPVAQCPDVKQGWLKGQEMVREALDLLDAGKPLTALRAPAMGPSKALSHMSRKMKTQARPADPVASSVDFREALEVWCAEENLTLLPLREAHVTTGSPLLRITASASGKGGVVAYIKGDVLWVQKKGDRTVYEPVGLGETLVERAEGR